MSKEKVIVNSRDKLVDLLAASDDYFAKEKNRKLIGFYTFLDDFIVHDHLPDFLWYRLYSEVFARLKGKGDMTAKEFYEVRHECLCNARFDWSALEVFYRIPDEEISRKMQYNFTPAYLIQ